MKGKPIALSRLGAVDTAGRLAQNAIFIIASYIARTCAPARFVTKNEDNAFLEGMQEIP